MAFEKLISGKTALILGLDNVIYPEKDYLLQVYYLFSEFMAYSEQMDSKLLISFMQREFEQYGSERIFEKTANKFNIPVKYAENFSLLHETARLPLKLLLFNNVLKLMQEALIDRIQLFLLVDGHPTQQLNKIKQIEWHGLEQYLKVYFKDELARNTSADCIEFILKNNNLHKDDVWFLGASEMDRIAATSAGIPYLSIEKIL